MYVIPVLFSLATLKADTGVEFGSDAMVVSTHLMHTYGDRMMDDMVFNRAAGAVMDVFGWVTYGKKSRNLDWSCLGYDDAWGCN